MWTVNDFPAYGMLSGWGTHGKMGCPHCMGYTKAFTLDKGGKSSWFDCHRRFLPAIIHIEETRQILKKMYERKICLRLDCHQGLYGTKFVNYQNLQILAKHAELKDTPSPTIGQKEVYFGTF